MNLHKSTFVPLFNIIILVLNIDKRESCVVVLNNVVYRTGLYTS